MAGYVEFEGKRYPFEALDPSPRLYMELQVQLSDATFTKCRTVKDLARIEGEILKLPAGKQDEHPEFLFYRVVTGWLALRCAGIPASLDAMVSWDDADYEAINIHADDEDESAGEGAGKAPRPGGGRVARPADHKPKRSSK